MKENYAKLINLKLRMTIVVKSSEGLPIPFGIVDDIGVVLWFDDTAELFGARVAKLLIW